MGADQETKYREALEQARMRLTHQTLKLQSVFKPEDVAGLLVGAAIGVLLDTFGHEKTREYFTDIARGLEHEERPSTH